MGIDQYSTTADDNTQINGINIAEQCPPGNINNAIRQLMADVASDIRPQMNEAINALLPGLIFPFSGMFGGEGNKYPVDPRSGVANTAYGLCDGSAYTSSDGRTITTPDLRDRFVIGAGGGYEAGDTGGATTKDTSDDGEHLHAQGNTGSTTLSIAQMPSHSHTAATISSGGGGTVVSYLKALGSTPNHGSAYTSATGGGGSHLHTNPSTAYAGKHKHKTDILPPYYALAFIMKL